MNYSYMPHPIVKSTVVLAGTVRTKQHARLALYCTVIHFSSSTQLRPDQARARLGTHVRTFAWYLVPW